MNHIDDRLANLAAMQDGWYDGHGKAPTPEAIASARSYLDGIHLVPKFDGGVQIESSAGDIEIEIKPDGSRSILVIASIPGPKVTT